jgi:hypothetical protein
MAKFLVTRIRTEFKEARAEIEADTYEDAEELAAELEFDDEDYEKIETDEENSVQTVSD